MSDLATYLGPYCQGSHHSSFLLSTVIADRQDFWRNQSTVEPEERAKMLNIGVQLREIATAQLLSDWAALTRAYHRPLVKAAATKSLAAGRKAKGFAPTMKEGQRPEEGYLRVNANLIEEGQLVDTWYPAGVKNLPPEMLKLLPTGTASS